MRIQHNIMAMNAYRNYSSNTSALSKNLEKLSSGYKINRAGDDAAGLAISEKMRAQITGLKTAQKNSKDGISLIQTAEGALTEVHDMLNRMVELADQSANGTYDNDTDRANLQKEFDALRGEVDRISKATNFNGINLLDGSQKATEIVTALGKLADMSVDGTTPNAATNANISVLLDNLANTTPANATKVTSGTKPTPATNATVKFQLNGVSTVEVNPGNFAQVDAVKSKVTSAALTATTYTNQDAAITVNYKDEDGTAKTADITFKTGTSAAELGTNFIKACSDDETLGELFTVSGSNTGVIFESKIAGANVAVTGVSVKTATSDTLSVPAGTLTGGIESKQADGKDLGYNMSSLKAGDAITINDVEYTYNKDLGANGYDSNKNTFGDLTGLASLLEKRGITADVATDKGRVTFKPKAYATTGSAFNAEITTGKTTIKELGALETDTDSIAVNTLFDLKVNGKSVDWTSNAKLMGGDTIELVAKTPGALTANNITDLKKIGGVAGLEVTDGVAEGGGSAATTSKYDIIFDFDRLADGQTLRIDDKLYEISTDGVKNGGADTTLIDLKNLDLTKEADQITAATAIRTALNTDFGGTFTLDAAPTAISGNSYTFHMEAQTAGITGNRGQVQVSESAVAAGAISGVYTAGTDASTAGKGTFASATYDFDISNFKVGDKLTIGDTTMEIVDDNTLADDMKANQIKLADAKTDTKLVNFFEAHGYDSGKITVDTTKNTITITDKKVGGDGAELLKGAGKLVYAPRVETKAIAGDKDLNIQTGKTTYADILKAKIGENDYKLGDIFNVKVNGKEVNAANESEIFQAGDKIEFEAKVAGQQSDDIMNSFNFTGGATVDSVNGTAEGQNSAGAKTQYELSFDFSKVADGQTFSIGDKTFELSTDGKAKDGNILINMQAINPGTEEGQLKLANAIQTAVNGEMGADFLSKAPTANDISGGKYALTLTAKEQTTDTNHGIVRVSESATGIITGKYTAAADADEAKAGTFAQVSYDFDIDKLEVGDRLTVGGTTIEITEGDSGNGRLSLADAKDADKLIGAFESNGYQSGKLSIADGKLTITGDKVGQTSEDLTKGYGKVSLNNINREPNAMEGGLTLQIGDTSDSYNQLTVSINKMDCASLGIDAASISIGAQDSAQAAVSVLKSAINSVSSTRGDLGAMQNRLEHTINNLSVMQENIQDAESTIRDVDVADEMMAYTKNNILVQSAQAMLAQANQVPQGVLQLLQ